MHHVLWMVTQILKPKYSLVFDALGHHVTCDMGAYLRLGFERLLALDALVLLSFGRVRLSLAADPGRRVHNHVWRGSVLGQPLADKLNDHVSS